MKTPKSSIREQKPPITTEEEERKRNREAGRIKGIPREEKLTWRGVKGGRERRKDGRETKSLAVEKNTTCLNF